MTLRDHDYSVPNLPQYRPVTNPLETDPGFFSELGAAFERNTAVAAIHWLSQSDIAPDPNFDFDATAKQSELYAQYPRAFLDVRSEAEFRQTEARVARAAESDRILSSGGYSAWVAALAAGIVDPVNLLPAGSIYKGYRVGNVLRTLLSTGAAGAGAGMINEAVLQADIPQRTMAEGLENVGMSALLSAVLGGTFSVALRGADRQVLNELASDMVGKPGSRTIYQSPVQPSSLGAAFNPEKGFENIPNVGELRPGFGLETTLSKINPIGRVLSNRRSQTARSFQASLDTGGMAFDGVANIGGDIESLAKQHYNRLAKAVWERDRILGGNKLSRLMSIPQFNEEVSGAIRRGGVHDDPAVAEYAQWVKREFFKPLYDEGKSVGLFPDLPEEFVNTYLSRFARHSLIARDYDQFYDMILEHSKEKLTDIWSKRVEATKTRIAKDEETASILELDIPDAAAKYAELREEIDNLPNQFPGQEGEIAQRIRDLREQAKGATKDEAKRLRAEANTLAASNKELLEGFYKSERKLKAQFRLLGKSKIGIAGANRRLVERIEAILEAADKSRDLLRNKLNKLAREFEDLSEEARNAAIDDAVAQVERMRELELKVTTRGPEFDTDEVRAAIAKTDEVEAELRELADLDPRMVADRIENIQSELIERGEALAATRRAEVERLTAKLQNPNDAKAEAAAIRNKAKDRWFDLQKRAANENVRLADNGEFAIDDLAKYYAESISSSYLGEHARLPFFDQLGGERGPELARMLDIDETRVWSNGKKLEDFLENDIDVIMRRYLRTVAPDIELKRKFGTVNPLDPKGPVMKQIEAEFQLARDEASKIESPKKREKELQSIAREREAVIRDLQLGLRRVRNLDGIPPDPYSFGHRAGRAMLNLNTARLMGKMVIGSMSDMAAAMARHGPARFLRDGLMPLVADWKRYKPALREAQLAGTALDLTLHGRSAAFADIFDDLRMGSRPERGLQFLANNIGFISGMDLWNQNMKTLASGMSIARTTDAIERLANGQARKTDLFHLERLGIDQQGAAEIWEALNSPGGSDALSGVRMPNTEEWGKDALARGDMGAFDRAMRARRTFRAALARDIDDTIVTPGGELPAFATASMPGRLLAQFRSFAFSSTMKTLIAGLQQSRVHGRASGSVMALSMVPFFLASGMLSYYLWAAASGDKAWNEMQNADAEKWITEGILRGLPLGVLSEAPRFSEEVLGVSADREASNFSSDPLDLLGPSVGLLKDTGRAVKGVFDDKAGMSKSEISSFRRILPYNNLWIWDWILRPTFEEAAR
ncbi:MAG TPA: hypothetical protein VK181_02600 [Rhizobium sp.]|nr:hypothetical protein [Rhizobium sp.]